jgi:hypothetical protein
MIWTTRVGLALANEVISPKVEEPNVVVDPKVGEPYDPPRGGEAGVIEDVEGLTPELEVKALPDPEILVEHEIRILTPRPKSIFRRMSP